MKSSSSSSSTSVAGNDEVEVLTMGQIVWRQFTEHRMAVLSVYVIAGFVLAAAGAPLISLVTGIDPDTQNIFHRYEGAFSTTEYSADNQEIAIEGFLEVDPIRAASIVVQLRKSRLVASGVADEDLIFEAVLGQSETPDALDKIWDLDTPEILALKSLVQSFTTFHLLGTDELGRDVFIRLIYGTRVSISFGILVAFASAFLGLLVGSLAGFYGGWVDVVFSRLIDSLLSLPTIPLMIIFAAVDLHKIPFVGSIMIGDNQSIVKLVIVIVLFSWMTVARLVRGSILSIKEQDFVLAAKTLGARDHSIIVTHIMPNVVSPLLVAVTLNVGNSILSEAALSFLGLGIQPPTPSWGNMLFNAQELIFESPILAIVPGILILVTVVSFNFVGDGLQNAIDPKAIRR